MKSNDLDKLRDEIAKNYAPNMQLVQADFRNGFNSAIKIMKENFYNEKKQMFERYDEFEVLISNLYQTLKQLEEQTSSLTDSGPDGEQWQSNELMEAHNKANELLGKYKDFK